MVRKCKECGAEIISISSRKYCARCLDKRLKEYLKKQQNKREKRIQESKKKQREKHYKKRLKLHKIWIKEHPDLVRKASAKRRKYGYNVLNVYFPCSIGHHVNDVDVVFIKENIHMLCYAGNNKELHRKKVMEYYGNLENMIKGISTEKKLKRSRKKILQKEYLCK